MNSSSTLYVPTLVIELELELPAGMLVLVFVHRQYRWIWSLATCRWLFPAS